MKRIFTILLLALCSLTIDAQQIAPDITLTDTQGNTHRLYDELNAGRSVVIDFFGLQCGSCQTDMSLLEIVWQNHGAGAGDVVVWAYETGGGSDYEVNDFVTINGGTFPSFKYVESDSLLDVFQLTVVPSYFVICPNGYMKKCAVDKIENYLSSCLTLGAEIEDKVEDHIVSAFAPSTSSYISINFSVSAETSFTFDLYDMLGNKIQTKSNYYRRGLQSVKMNKSGLSKGYYFIRMTNKNHFMETKRIVIN